MVIMCVFRGRKQFCKVCGNSDGIFRFYLDSKSMYCNNLVCFYTNFLSPLSAGAGGSETRRQTPRDHGDGRLLAAGEKSYRLIPSTAMLTIPIRGRNKVVPHGGQSGPYH